MIELKVYVWKALEKARAEVGAVVASERGEVKRRGSADREFAYPPSEDVHVAANRALATAQLLWIPAEIGAATQGVDGTELPITFTLIHTDSGEAVDFPVKWALADAANFVGRPQARAATLDTASKHMLRKLLGIQVKQEDEGAVLDRTIGRLPEFASTAATAATAGPSPYPRSEPPPQVAVDFRSWQSKDFRRRFAEDPNAGVRMWTDVTALALGGEPRPTTSAAEDEAVHNYLLRPGAGAAV